MGKPGSWFSAIKRVFSPHTKDKLTTESSDKKNTKEKKKKGLGRQTTSFIPLFREPSSIEKILDEAEREHKLIFQPPTPPDQPRTPLFVPVPAPAPAIVNSPRAPSQRVTSPRAASPRAAPPNLISPKPASPRAASPKPISPKPASPRAASPKPISPKPASPRTAPKNALRHKEKYNRPEPTVRNHHASATKIQAAYRGYAAIRSFRALKGLVRLQGVVKGQSVKRQTVNAMKYMQLLVRVQSQIQSRRIQMLENQARRQAQNRNEKEEESTFGKWGLASEAGDNEDWDDSVLTKEEIEARTQRRMEAVVKRERAMAYAYSNQLWKSTEKSTQSAMPDIRSNGFPWWWSWLERQIPATNPTTESQAVRNFQMTPPRAHSELKPSPRPSSSFNIKQQSFGFDNLDTPTPRSSKSTAFVSTRPARTPLRRTPQGNNSPSLSKYPRPRGSPFNLPLKDDDSLTSCPPFSVPNYMAPTVSAKAKVRASSNPKERFPGTTPSSEKNRRGSFPLTQGVGSFKWNKGSFFSGKDSSSQAGGLDKHESLQSVGNMSVDSTVSMPAAIGRRPFNRFV